MTLSGVLKDILLVGASMVIFRDPVSLTQAFGYSIALGGLVFYKLGGDGIKNSARDAQLYLGTLRQNNPARAKALVFGGVILILTIVVLAFWPAIPSEYKTPLGH